jgi:hypothetical protein
MHPKALLVMRGVAVLIADGAFNESNDFDSTRKSGRDATTATHRVKAAAVVQAV